MQTTSEYVTIAEAAQRLGISKSAVRRRLHSGQLGGRQEERPQGHIWLIALPSGQGTVPPNGHANGAARTATSRHVPADDGTSRQAAAGAAVPGTALQRAQEMAVYSEQLLRPYVAKIEAQATEIGVLTERTTHLQTELEATRARVAELEAAPASTETTETTETPSAPSAESRAGRSWWRRLFG
jgi:hypothetical protein